MASSGGAEKWIPLSEVGKWQRTTGQSITDAILSTLSLYLHRDNKPRRKFSTAAKFIPASYHGPRITDGIGRHFFAFFQHSIYKTEFLLQEMLGKEKKTKKYIDTTSSLQNHFQGNHEKQVVFIERSNIPRAAEWGRSRPWTWTRFPSWSRFPLLADERATPG